MDKLFAYFVVLVCLFFMFQSSFYYGSFRFMYSSLLDVLKPLEQIRNLVCIDIKFGIFASC